MLTIFPYFFFPPFFFTHAFIPTSLCFFPLISFSSTVASPLHSLECFFPFLPRSIPPLLSVIMPLFTRLSAFCYHAFIYTFICLLSSHHIYYTSPSLLCPFFLSPFSYPSFIVRSFFPSFSSYPSFLPSFSSSLPFFVFSPLLLFHTLPSLFARSFFPSRHSLPFFLPSFMFIPFLHHSYLLSFLPFSSYLFLPSFLPFI